MRGGHPVGRILLAVALLALPLIGLVALRDGSSALPGSSVQDAVLRLAPGHGSDTRAVRPGPDAEAGARSATGTRGLGLLAVLLGAMGTGALAATRGGRSLAVVPVRTGHRPAASGRGPPHLPR